MNESLIAKKTKVEHLTTVKVKKNMHPWYTNTFFLRLILVIFVTPTHLSTPLLPFGFGHDPLILMFSDRFPITQCDLGGRIPMPPCPAAPLGLIAVLALHGAKVHATCGAVRFLLLDVA